MDRWSEERWEQLEDGSYRRRAFVPLGSYDEMSKAQLMAELERRGLSKTGAKDVLLARLEESDVEGDE